MDYDYFIGMVRLYETERIKAFRGKHPNAIAKIPAAFALLVNDVINIIEKNIATLCCNDESLVILGLQPAAAMIKSKTPTQWRRFLGRKPTDQHYCCTLDYAVAPHSDASNVVNWQETKSLVIDFTAGDVMDTSEYLSRLSLAPNPGTIYGEINSHSLITAWQIAKIKHHELSIAA